MVLQCFKYLHVMTQVQLYLNIYKRVRYRQCFHFSVFSVLPKSMQGSEAGLAELLTCTVSEQSQWNQDWYFQTIKLFIPWHHVILTKLFNERMQKISFFILTGLVSSLEVCLGVLNFAKGNTTMEEKHIRIHRHFFVKTDSFCVTK